MSRARWISGALFRMHAKTVYIHPNLVTDYLSCGSCG